MTKVYNMVQITKSDMAICLFLFWGLFIGCAKTSLPLDSTIYLKWLLMFLVYIFISKVLRNCFYAMIGLTTAGLVQAFVSFCQSFGIMDSGNQFFQIIGFMGNPGPLGGFQSVAAVSGISMLATMKSMLNKNWYVIGYVAVVIIICSVLLSGSRAGILAVVLCLALMNIQKISRFAVEHKFAFIALTIFIITPGYFAISVRLDSVLARLLIWLVSFKMVKDNFIFGLGPGQFSMKYMLYQAEYFRMNPDSMFALVADNAAYPYNEFIHILVELGIIGLLLAVILFVTVFKNAKHKEILLPLAALLFFSCFSYPSYHIGLMLLFPILIGAAGSDSVLCEFHSNSIKRYLICCLYVVVIAAVIIKITTIHSDMQEYLYGKKVPDDDMNILFQKTYMCHKTNMLYSNLVLNNPILIENNASDKMFPMCETWCGIGKIMMEKNDFISAEYYFKTAADMIPTRIRPKYLLWKMMISQDRDIEAAELGRQILSQPIKVNNTFILRVRQEIREKYNIHRVLL